jgi:hypothetical protein
MKLLAAADRVGDELTTQFFFNGVSEACNWFSMGWLIP